MPLVLLTAGLALLLWSQLGFTQGAAVVISGVVTDARTGETLPGATILLVGTNTGVSADLEGRFSISTLPGSHTLEVTFVGYQDKTLSVELADRVDLQIRLEPKETLLQEVVVSGRRSGDHIERTEMGVARLDARAIAQIPAMLGEVDVIRAIQLLPGVQSVGEGSSGFNVRGGSMDQNLILMDEATVYNASHLMGFFSVFNNDVVDDVSLYKGNIPAQYGGRLSSLLNVSTREGSMDTFQGAGGVGSIFSRLALEGPIVKDRASFIVAGRRSYADIFLPLSPNTDLHDNRLFFYDVNAKLNMVVDDRNRVRYSAFHGKDVFRIGASDPFTMEWGNTAHTLNWKSMFRDNWLMTLNLVYTGYAYALGFESTASPGFVWEAGNNEMGGRLDFSWFPNSDHQLRFGLSTIYHQFNPGVFRGIGDSFFGESPHIGSNALSHAIYLSNEHQISRRWSADYGLRGSLFQSMGEATVYRFDGDYNAIDSTHYGRGEVFNNWAGLEPRLGVRYALNDRSSFKASYNRTFQYLHLASYSDGGNPLDVWLPSSPHVKPQIANQYAAGYFYNLHARDQVIETSVELFYKTMQNQVDFKDNAWLMLNPRIEGEFRFGRAWAYGAELLIRKNEGRLNGWISYTWSRAQRQVGAINAGNPYPASFDRPHNFNLVVNYELSPRVTLSGTWVYTSGSPVTLPAGRFEYGNHISPVYTERNGYRLPDYHRLDLGAVIKGRERKERRFRDEWNISVYNAYYRKNTWMLDFVQDVEQPGQIDAYKVYLFPILPSVTYNFFF